MTTDLESGLSQQRRILKNTVANGSAQAASMIATFILLPLLVRSFGVADFGVMVLASSIGSWALLLDLGVSAALVRTVAERTVTNDDAGLSGAVSSAAVIYTVLGLLAALVMALLAWTAYSVFAVSPQQALLLRTLLLIGAVQQLWYWPTLAARDALSGMQRYDLVSSVTLAFVFVDVAGSVYVILTGSGPVTLVLIRFVAMLAASIANVALAWRLLPRPARRLRANLDDVRAILQSGSSVFVLQIAQVMSRQQADKLVLGIFLGPSAVTLYEIAAKLSSLVTTFTSLTVSAILPVAARLSVQQRHATIRALFLRGTKVVATLAAPLVAVLIVIAGPLIEAWMGPGFEAAVPVAQLLLLSQALLPLYQLGDQIMIGKNRFSAWVPGGLTLAVLNIALSVILVQWYGLIGVAVGTLIAVALEFPWYTRVFGREIDLGIGEWLRSTAWPTYPLLVLPALIAWLGGQTGLGDSILGLAVVSATALLVFWAAMWIFGYSAEEREGLLAVLRRVPTQAGQ